MRSVPSSFRNCLPRVPLLSHPGVLLLATKVGYFGVKSAKVLPGADGHLIC